MKKSLNYLEILILKKVIFVSTINTKAVCCNWCQKSDKKYFWRLFDFYSIYYFIDIYLILGYFIIYLIVNCQNSIGILCAMKFFNFLAYFYFLLCLTKNVNVILHSIQKAREFKNLVLGKMLPFWRIFWGKFIAIYVTSGWKPSTFSPTVIKLFLWFIY